MPWRLRKAPKRDLYWVVDDKGKHYSKDPMPKKQARQQQKALYAAESRGEMRGGNLNDFLNRLTQAQQAFNAGDEDAAWELIYSNPADPDHQAIFNAFNNAALQSNPDVADDFGAWSNIVFQLLDAIIQEQEEAVDEDGFQVVPEADEDPELAALEGANEEAEDPYKTPSTTPDPSGSGRKKGRGVKKIGRPETAAAPTPVASPPPLPPAASYRRPIRRRESIERLRPEAQVRLAMRELVPGPIADRIVSFADPENRVELARIRRRMEELDALIPRNRRGEPFVGPEHREIAMELMSLARRRRQLEGRGLKGGARILRKIERATEPWELVEDGRVVATFETEEQAREFTKYSFEEVELPHNIQDQRGFEYDAPETGWIVKKSGRTLEQEGMPIVFDSRRQAAEYVMDEISGENERQREEAAEDQQELVASTYRGTPPPSRPTQPTTPKPRRGRGLSGCGMPGRDLLQQMSKASYQDVPPKMIAGWSLVYSTPTLKMYRSGNTIVVAIRGTRPTDKEDLKADALIAVNKLETSTRYKKDFNVLRNFQNRYSPKTYEYYGVGHSLGGAILDAFLNAGLLRSGLSYNPAIQPKDFKASLENQRVYQEGDPLYKLMGSQVEGVEVRKTKPKGVLDSLIERIPVVGQAYDLYKQHALDNFQGGRKPNKAFQKQLNDEGVRPEAYLAEARRRAAKADYPSQLLGFADDGIHKLAIPDEEGRIIKFGRVGYRDHLIYTDLEKAGKVPKGTAKSKKERFQKSHSAMKGDWKSNDYSPNNLALRVLW